MTRRFSRALASGFVGAAALTAVHQLARYARADAPRMDLLGMRGLSRIIGESGYTPPAGRQLYWMALAGDLIANSVFYAAIPAASSRGTWTRALALGTLAGAGAVGLPEPLGLGAPPHSHEPANRVMTVAWYVVGACAAAAWAERQRPQRPAAMAY